MKFAVVLLATTTNAETIATLHVSETALPVLHRIQRNAPRRYFQLQEQLEEWVGEAGVPYDERNLWTYGCHCNFLGDRPLSEMGRGKPKDKIDGLCKRYHHCLQCTRIEYGQMCIGERVEYGLENSVTCSNGADTCGRSLCECDAAFAQEYALLLKSGESHNDEWHEFYNDDFKREEECVATGFGNGGNLECCRNEAKSSPFIMFNRNRQMCCKDGTSSVLGGCEEGTVAPPTMIPYGK